MKSTIQFILSMIIFGTIGFVVRYIDLASSERALFSSSIGCLFLICIFLMMKKGMPWAAIKVHATILFFSGIALAGNWIFLYQSYDDYKRHTELLFCTCVCYDSCTVRLEGVIIH